jgi:hypothetical protein
MARGFANQMQFNLNRILNFPPRFHQSATASMGCGLYGIPASTEQILSQLQVYELLTNEDRRRPQVQHGPFVRLVQAAGYRCLLTTYCKYQAPLQTRFLQKMCNLNRSIQKLTTIILCDGHKCR